MSIVSVTQLENAKVDCEALEDVVNGPESGTGSTVATRLGGNLKTVARLQKEIHDEALSILDGFTTDAANFTNYVVSAEAPELVDAVTGLSFELPEVVAFIDGKRVVGPAISASMPANYMRHYYLKNDGTWQIAEISLGAYPDIQRYFDGYLKIWTLSSSGTAVNRIALTSATYKEKKRIDDYAGSLERLIELYYLKTGASAWTSGGTVTEYGSTWYTPAGDVYIAVEPGTFGTTAPTGMQSGEDPLMNGTVGLFYFGTLPYLGMFRYAPNNGLNYYFTNIGVVDIIHRKTIAPSPLGVDAGVNVADLVLGYIRKVFYHMIIGRVNSADYGFAQKMHTNGMVWECRTVAGGTTASSSPFSGSYSIGNTVTDGTITWKAIHTHYSTHNAFWLDVGPDFASYRSPDSHDSYASSLVSVIARYGRVMGDAALISLMAEDSDQFGLTIQDCFTLMLDANLTDQITANHLTYTFQDGIAPDGSSYDIQFTEDNCESAAGFRDAAYIYDVLGETALRDAAQANYEEIDLQGVNSLYNTDLNVYARYYGDDPTTWDEKPGWYPYCQAQFFPEYYNLQCATATKRLNARESVFRMWPNWITDKARSDFPDNFIGVLAAGNWQDSEKAYIFVEYMDRYYLPTNGMTISEFANYLLIKEILHPPFTLLSADEDRLLVREPGGEFKRINLTPPTPPANTPSFRATMNAAQHLGAATTAKLNFNTAVFDTNSDFDSTNKRFVPSVAGKYQISAKANFINGGSGGLCFIYIYKNGSLLESRTFAFPSSVQDCIATISAIVDMNGTTDYVEIYGQTGVTANPDVYFSEAYCSFEGFKLIGA